MNQLDLNLGYQLKLGRQITSLKGMLSVKLTRFKLEAELGKE